MTPSVPPRYATFAYNSFDRWNTRAGRSLPAEDRAALGIGRGGTVNEVSGGVERSETSEAGKDRPAALPATSLPTLPATSLPTLPATLPASGVPEASKSLAANSGQISGQRKSVSIWKPAARQCSSSRRPSTTKRPSSRRRRDFSCSASKCLIFGFWADVIRSIILCARLLVFEDRFD